jgi:glutathione S-transferase
VNPDRSIVFYHAPHTRSGGVRMLLEELAVPYAMHVLNVKKGEQRMPAYLAINPMGKVPAITHGDALITEQGAVYQYLADLFPEVDLAPQMGDPLRGPYLRWLYFYGSCFEPAVVDRSMKREPASPSTSPYGTFDTVLKTINDQLATGPWLLGERFSAADVLWGSALGWTTGFKLVPASPSMQAYIDRFNARPAIARARAADAELAASQG